MNTEFEPQSWTKMLRKIHLVCFILEYFTPKTRTLKILSPPPKKTMLKGHRNISGLNNTENQNKNSSCQFFAFTLLSLHLAPPPHPSLISVVKSGPEIFRWPFNIDQGGVGGGARWIDKKVKIKNLHEEFLFWFYFSCFVFPMFRTSVHCFLLLLLLFFLDFSRA